MKTPVLIFMSIIGISMLLPALPAADQVITAGFHRRGPSHPAGGTEATCIGEDGLLNPLENGTELADPGDYPKTLLEEHSLTGDEFGTMTYRTGPTIRVEIETLDTDLFDRRGPVRMELISAISPDDPPGEGGSLLGAVNRTNSRWIATADSGIPERMAGVADIRYEHDRGNAGGHIQVCASDIAVTVTVRDNNGNPASGTNKYLDGQEAFADITVDPAIYQNRIDAIDWDMVDTDPEGNKEHNPAETPITVVSQNNNTVAYIDNVRWAGIEGGTDDMTGDKNYCNKDITWNIDGTFTVAGIEIEGAETPGELIATVKLGNYISGSTAPVSVTTGQGVGITRNIEGTLYLVGGWRGRERGRLRLAPVALQPTVTCLPNSQFLDLVTQHENRHVVQIEQRKGPVGLTLRNINQLINATNRIIAAGNPIPVANQAHANQVFTERVEAEGMRRMANIRANIQTKCWTERDADEAAKRLTDGKKWWLEVECRYPCDRIVNCRRCPLPNGRN